MKRFGIILLGAILALFFLTACTEKSIPTSQPAETVAPPSTPEASSVPPTPEVRALTVCMGREPASLLLYGDQSAAARNVREAIYDGPMDVLGYEYAPVILQEKPALENGGVVLEAVQVQPGAVIVDASGKQANLAEGVRYYPNGCGDDACAVVYSGNEPASLDQMVVRFTLKADVQWSDGAPLTADDSAYSFEVAQALFPRARADLISQTQSYRSLDARTVEWRGVPGYRNARYPTFFFTPLPRHAWGSIAAADLLSAEPSNRVPLGWGPYVIQEWISGDHITLVKNPLYFRSKEGLPHFDSLVFRFISDPQQALMALQAGECDYLDETAGLDTIADQAFQLKNAGKVAILVKPGTAWEHIDFGITPYTMPGEANTQPSHLSFFSQKEVRQAVAQCIDRAGLAQQVSFGQAQLTNSYIPSNHPLYNAQVKQYEFNPSVAGALLQAAGWMDDDNNPATPRIARGVVGIPDGTPFEVQYLTTDEADKQLAAQVVQTGLAQCGIKMNIVNLTSQELFASGPEGSLFGRKFDMAQYAWISSVEPACFLYLTEEIPGPYPEYPKGWGGANAPGYSNQTFDQACQKAQASLPGQPQYREFHLQAQAIFAEYLPVVPLYMRNKIIAMRSDLCQMQAGPSAESTLWNLESFSISQTCDQ